MNWKSPSLNVFFSISTEFLIQILASNAPVICIPGSLGAGDSGDIAGPKCRDLTFDESRQCRRCAGVLISRQMPIYDIVLQQRESSACTFAQSDQLLFRCLDEHASWNRMVAKPQTLFYSLSGSCVHCIFV